MGLILFGSDTVIKREGAKVAIPEWTSTTYSEGAKTTQIFTIDLKEGAKIIAPVDDPRGIKVSAPLVKYEDGRPFMEHIRMVTHTDFNQTSTVYSTHFTMFDGEIVGDKRRPLPSYPNNNKLTHTNTKHQITATAQDGRIVMIEPFTNTVRLFDSIGNCIFHETFESGNFEDLIGLTADTTYIYCLHWKDNCENGGNKIVIQTRFWADAELVVYDWQSDGAVVAAPINNEAENQAAKTGILFVEDFYYSIVSAPFSPVLLVGAIVAAPLDDYYGAVVAAPLDIYQAVKVSAPIVSQINAAMVAAPITGLPIESRDSRVKTGLTRKSRNPSIPVPEPILSYEEIDKLHTGFNAEEDTWWSVSPAPQEYDDYRAIKDVIPLPTHPLHPANLRDIEQEYEEGDTLKYYGLRYERRYPEDGSTHYYFSVKKRNARWISNPKIVATETKLYLIIGIRNSSFPWRTPGKSQDDPEYRSAYSLVYEIDKTFKTITNSAGVPMSCQMDVQARDDIGIVMLDSFYESAETTGNDALPGYILGDTNTNAKLMDLVILDPDTLEITHNHEKILRSDITSDYYISFMNGDWEGIPTTNIQGIYNLALSNKLRGNYYDVPHTLLELGCILRLCAEGFIVSTGPNVGYDYDNSRYIMGGDLTFFSYDLVTKKRFYVPRHSSVLSIEFAQHPVSAKVSAPINADGDSIFAIVSAPLKKQLFEAAIINAPLDYYGASKVAAIIDDYSGVKVSAPLSIYDYIDSVKIITNQCPVEYPDLVGKASLEFNPSNRIFGIYSNSAYQWYLGVGLDSELNTISSWRVGKRDDSSPDITFPHPVQYVVDELTNEIFGIFRLWENQEELASYTAYDPITDETYTLGTSETNQAMNYPIGGVIHSYSDIMSYPKKSLTLPGYVNIDTPLDYDPFIQYRHLGISSKNKRIYIIRSAGRRDFYSYNYSQTLRYVPTKTTSRYDTWRPVYITDGYPLYSGGNWNTSYQWADDGTGQYDEISGDIPECSGGIYYINNLDYTPFSSVEYTLIDKHYGPDFTKIFESNGDIIYDNLVYYEMSQNVYDNVDILIYDYDLNYVRRLYQINGIDNSEIIVHLREKNDVFYVITQTKNEEFDWGSFNQSKKLAYIAGTSNFKDDKYGFIYKSLKVYKIQSTLSNTPELIKEIPFGTHTSSDVLIQDITEKYIWLNWDGIRKQRSGAFSGIGVPLNGDDIIKVNGLVAIIPNLYGIDNALLCYKNDAVGVAFDLFNVDDEYELLGGNSSVLPKYGKPNDNELVVLNADSLGDHETHNVYMPSADFPDRGLIRYGINPGETMSPNQFLKSGVCPAYSQVTYQRSYISAKVSAPITIENKITRPQTSLHITTGGPYIYKL